MARSELTLREIAADALLNDLRTALETPIELLRDLASSLETDRGFRVRDEKRLVKTWASSGLGAKKLSDTYSVLRHLFDHTISSEKTPQEMVEEIGELCSFNAIPGFEERRSALLSLLTPSERYLERRLVVPWAKNVLFNLVAIDTGAELRAAFRSAGSEEILGLIPMAILRLAVKYDDDKDTQVRRISMQLTDDDIDELIDTLQVSKRRLASLGQYVGRPNVKLHKEITRGQWGGADSD